MEYLSLETMALRLSLPVLILASAQAAFMLKCGGDPDGASSCPEGQIRVDGSCIDYVPDDPVDPGDAWRPEPGTTWQWQLTGELDTALDVQMYDVDLFDVTDEELSSLVDRVVICYFSAGTIEDWRPDAHLFPDHAIGLDLEDWPDERWVDVRDSRVRAIMVARLNMAVDRGCDGVEPDNMDGYANDTGLGISATQQLEYNRFIADQAHERGLSVGLKNDVEQMDELVDWFDWALNEQCHQFDECSAYDTFIDGGKAVFHVEYVDDWSDSVELASEVCGSHPGLSTLIKTWGLGSEFLACG